MVSLSNHAPSHRSREGGTPPGVGAVREPPPRPPSSSFLRVKANGAPNPFPSASVTSASYPSFRPRAMLVTERGVPHAAPCRAKSPRRDREKQQNATLFRKHPRLSTPVALFFRSEPAVASCRDSVALALHFVRIGVAFRLDRCCIRPHPTFPSIPLRPGAAATIPPSGPP